MSTDRELLELAAKAAGMEGWRYSGPSGLHKMLDPSSPQATGSVGPPWNPLTDDGDALRLAVKLGLAITPIPIYSEHKHGVIAKLYRNSSAIYRGRAKNIEFDEMHGNDPFAATRRAIVGAASEIGRQMP